MKESKTNFLSGHSKKLIFILVLLVIISCYYQVNISQTDFRPYKAYILQFIFDDNSSQLELNKTINTKNTTTRTTATTRPSMMAITKVSPQNDNPKKVVSLKFAQVHASILLNRTEQRVVFYKITQVGYGNRLYSMLSAFLAAVVSDSALLIDWANIDAYVHSPLVDVFRQYNDASFLDINQKVPKICTISTNTPNTWAFGKQLNFLQDIQLPAQCSRYYVSDITPYFFDLAANLKYSQKLIDYGFVREKTVRRAEQSLNNSNATQNQKLENLFLIGFEFAGHVLNNYWLLKPSLLQKVDKFVEEKFKNNFIIGFQMRFEYLNRDDIDRFVNCALSIESSQNASVAGRKVKWFLSTDQSEQVRDMVTKYADRIVTAEGKIGHVAWQADAYERALIDIELLSRCDEAVLTGGSTFGFIALIKSQKRPYYVEGKRSMPQCKVFEFYAPPRTPSGAAVFR